MHPQSAQDFNVYVIKNAYKPDVVESLLENVWQYRDTLSRHIIDGTLPTFPDSYNFKFGNRAIDLWCFDPDNIELNSAEMLDSSIYKALRNGERWAEIDQILPEDRIFRRARVRMVDKNGGRAKHRGGVIYFHQEKVVVSGKFQLPIGWNLWCPMNDSGMTTNVDVPGLQFFLGDIASLDVDGEAEAGDDATNLYRSRMRRLDQLSDRARDADEEFVEIDGRLLFRPRVALGDILLFDHVVAHSSFVPPKASAPRISCELRIFPTAGMPKDASNSLGFGVD